MQYNYLVDIMHTTDESLKTAIHRIDRESDNKILACLYSQSRGIEDLHVMGFGLTKRSSNILDFICQQGIYKHDHSW